MVLALRDNMGTSTIQWSFAGISHHQKRIKSNPVDATADDIPNMREMAFDRPKRSTDVPGKIKIKTKSQKMRV
jgi:hypothetical protein